MNVYKHFTSQTTRKPKPPLLRRYGFASGVLGVMALRLIDDLGLDETPLSTDYLK